MFYILRLFVIRRLYVVTDFTVFLGFSFNVAWLILMLGVPGNAFFLSGYCTVKGLKNVVQNVKKGH